MFGRQVAGMVLMLGVASFCGCGRGGSSINVVVPPDKQSRLSENGKMATLQLPQDVPFNHANADRHSSGDAKAESVARADGTGSAHITVGTNGAADASFQIGHVMYSGSEAPVDAVVRFDCRFTYEVLVEDLTRHSPDTIDLRIVVEDTNQRKLSELILVSQADHFGAEHREGRESPSFNVRLEPGVAYVLRVTGRLSAEGAKDEPPVEARLEVMGLSIEVRPRVGEDRSGDNNAT